MKLLQLRQQCRLQQAAGHGPRRLLLPPVCLSLAPASARGHADVLPSTTSSSRRARLLSKLSIQPARSRVRASASSPVANDATVDQQGGYAEEEGDEVVGSTRAPRDPKHTAPEVLERGAPELPYPGEYQQTLVASFTLGGVGLHSNQEAVVRVRPAYANEGRYFVHVPQGTNSGRLEMPQVPDVELEDGGQMPLDPELEDRKVALFKQYLLAQEDEGFEGTFKEFLHDVDARDLLAKYNAGEDPHADEWEFKEPEPIQARAEGEGVSANMASVHFPAAVTLVLGELEDENSTVIGAELLLAALEACGVDNARIEIEGGVEIPQLDGSALSWALEVQFSGLRPAPLPGYEDAEPPTWATEEEVQQLERGMEAALGTAPAQAEGGEGEEQEDEEEELPPPRVAKEGFVLRQALRYQGEAFVVQSGDAYMSFVPEDTVRVTAGVDVHMVSEVIGKQWFTWCLYEDLAFRFEVAGARKWLPSPRHLQIYSGLGFYKGFTPGTVMMAKGEDWHDPAQLRYVRDEAARFEIAITLGMLSLLARPGHAGLPMGHITSYKASPELRLIFARELLKRCAVQEDQEQLWQTVFDVPLSCNPVAEEVANFLEFTRDQALALAGYEDPVPGSEEGMYGEGEEEGEEEHDEEEGAGRAAQAREEGDEEDEDGGVVDVDVNKP